MAKKNLIYLLIILLLLAGCGILGAKFYLAHKQLAWYEKVLTRFYPPLPTEIYQCSGKIIEKGADYLIMEAYFRVTQLPKPDGSELVKRIIKVKVTPDTRIYQEMPVEPWAMGMGLGGQTEQELTLADLNLQTQILVTTIENILTTSEVTAKEIKLTI